MRCPKGKFLSKMRSFFPAQDKGNFRFRQSCWQGSFTQLRMKNSKPKGAHVPFIFTSPLKLLFASSSRQRRVSLPSSGGMEPENILRTSNKRGSNAPPDGVVHVPPSACCANANAEEFESEAFLCQTNRNKRIVRMGSKSAPCCVPPTTLEQNRACSFADINGKFRFERGDTTGGPFYSPVRRLKLSSSLFREITFPSPFGTAPARAVNAIQEKS